MSAGTTLNNAAKGTVNIQADASISGGSITNAGTLEKTKGTGTTTISSALNTTGKVLVSSGTLNVTGAVTQVTGATLTAGTWQATGTATIHSTLTIGSASNFTTIGTTAVVTLSGPNSAFTNLAAPTTNQGSLSLLAGQSFATPGALTNSGKITLSPGSVLTVNGNLTATSTSKLTIQIGGTSAAPTVRFPRRHWNRDARRNSDGHIERDARHRRRLHADQQPGGLGHRRHVHRPALRGEHHHRRARLQDFVRRRGQRP